MMYSKNFFLDDKLRKLQILTIGEFEKLIFPLEEIFGDKNYYSSTKEACDLYLEALSQVGVYASNIQKNAALIDAEGALYHPESQEVVLPSSLSNNLEEARKLSLFSISSVSRKWDGLNFPKSIHMLMLEMLGEGCPNTGLTICAYSMAGFFEMFANKELQDTYMQALSHNKLIPAMALTEPDAGSDLGALTSKARPIQGTNMWEANGAKRFITNGHGDLLFTLVRTDPSSKGLKGLSVLIIPKMWDEKKNVQVTKIEHKVCLHASPTCELLLENSKGFLLGPEGDGFRVMTELMNEARLAMAALSLGIVVSAYKEAFLYAQTRHTMGSPIYKHPLVSDMLDEMETEIFAMRALILSTSVQFDWLKIGRHNDPDNIKKYLANYHELTPLCKYYVAERAIPLVRNALQIFGGYGVSTEYPIERLLRETLIYPIYEGTSQIQSLMVIKTILKSNLLTHVGGLATRYIKIATTRGVGRVLLEVEKEWKYGVSQIFSSLLKVKIQQDLSNLKVDKKVIEFVHRLTDLSTISQGDLGHVLVHAERLCRLQCNYQIVKILAEACHHPEFGEEFQSWFYKFSELAIPRMQFENSMMKVRPKRVFDFIEKGSQTFSHSDSHS